MKFCIPRTIHNRIHTQSSHQIFVNTLLNWNSLCTMCTVYVGPLRIDFHMPDSKCMKSCFLYLVWDNFLYIAQKYLLNLGIGIWKTNSPPSLHPSQREHISSTHSDLSIWGVMHPLGVFCGEAKVSIPSPWGHPEPLRPAPRWCPAAETTTFLNTWMRKKTKPQCGKERSVLNLRNDHSGLPWWLNGKESTCKAGTAEDAGSIPGSGRSPGGEHGNPLQYSCLKNPMDRGAWRATVHGVAKSRTGLKWLSTHSCQPRSKPCC